MNAANSVHAADRLVASTATTGSIACVGLDPRPELLPSSLVADALRAHEDPLDQVCHAFLAFNQGVLDAVAGACAAVKPQSACYEAYGWRGWRVLEATIEHAHSLGIPVILDAKRGDIGSTAIHYRQGLLTEAPVLEEGASVRGLGVDWITASPFLGSDSVEPLIGSVDEGKGAFILARTSNPGADDVQGLLVGGEHLSTVVARLVHEWGVSRIGDSGYSDVGAVVGATWPQIAAALRQLMPHTLFLVPGFGAQGGSAAHAVAGASKRGDGVLVSSSRAIAGAWQSADADSEFAAAARDALDRMNDLLNAAMAAQATSRTAS